MMALPPFDAGAVKAMLAAPLLGVAAPMVGAPGGVIATTVYVTVGAAAKKQPGGRHIAGSVVLSLTRIVGANVPSAVGVPVSRPVGDIVVPVGKAPVSRENVYGAVPPVPTN